MATEKQIEFIKSLAKQAVAASGKITQQRILFSKIKSDKHLLALTNEEVSQIITELKFHVNMPLQDDGQWGSVVYKAFSYAAFKRELDWLDFMECETTTGLKTGAARFKPDYVSQYWEAH